MKITIGLKVVYVSCELDNTFKKQIHTDKKTFNINFVNLLSFHILKTKHTYLQLILTKNLHRLKFFKLFILLTVTDQVVYQAALNPHNSNLLTFCTSTYILTYTPNLSSRGLRDFWAIDSETFHYRSCWTSAIGVIRSESLARGLSDDVAKHPLPLLLLD